MRRRRDKPRTLLQAAGTVESTGRLLEGPPLRPCCGRTVSAIVAAGGYGARHVSAMNCFIPIRPSRKQVPCRLPSGRELHIGLFPAVRWASQITKNGPVFLNEGICDVQPVIFRDGGADQARKLLMIVQL